MHAPRTTTLRLGGLLVALLCAAPASPGSAGGPATLAPFVSLTGATSHVSEERTLRITTQDEWAATWLQHLGLPPKSEYDLYFNKAGLPVVDFERCMVVAVFAGATQNCAGVSAVSAPLEDPQAETKTPVASGDEVLRLSWHGYQTMGPDGGGKDVAPFGFFVLPRMTAPLVVQDREMPLGGGRGRLVQRTRLPALPEGGR